MGLFNPHASNRSVLGLAVPDFGLTEKISDVLGQGRTSQGGSNLFGASAAAPSSNQILGSQNTSTLPQASYNPSGGFGSLVNQGGGVPANQNQPAPQQNPQQNFTQQVDNAQNEYLSKLDELAGLLPGQAQGQRDFVNEQYGLQSQGISDAEKSNLAKIDTSRNAATQRKSVTLRDIASDLTNALQAGNIFLGNLGASDSSAVGRMGGAMAKAANKRTTDVNTQWSDAMSQLDQKEIEIQQVAQEQVRELDMWKSSALQQIQGWLDQQMQQVQGMKTEDARQLWAESRQQAMNQLAQIDQQAQQFQAGLQEWALSRSENINQLRNNLSQVAQFQQPNYAYDAFANPQTVGGGGMTTPAQGYGSSLEDQQQTSLGRGLTTADITNAMGSGSLQGNTPFYDIRNAYNLMNR